MENATKALIMAGAILIVILIISTGILIVKSTEGVQEEAERAAQASAAGTFNSKIDPYIGQNKPLREVKALISYIISSNAINENHKIRIFYNGAEKTNLNTLLGELTSSFYKVNIIGNGRDEQGYITAISIRSI